MTTRNEWVQDALCAQVDPDLFTLDQGGSTAAAKRICQACEVRQICLQEDLDNHEEFSVWGGLAPMERAALLRRNGTAA